MGILSECLVLLLICQALNVISFEQAVGIPRVSGGDGDVAEFGEKTEEMVDFQPEAEEYDMFADFVKRGSTTDGQDPGGCKQPVDKRNRSQKQLNQDILAWHTYYRCLHGVSKVTYSTTLEQAAKRIVKKNVRQGGMEHSSGNPYGENLWAMWGTGYGTSAVTGQDPVKAWYNEMKDYDFRTPTGFSSATGHFTQVVWKATKKIGCWTADHPFRGMTRVFSACEYDPPGNMNLRPKSKNTQNWKTNVLPPK